MATSDSPLNVPNVTLAVARGASNPPTTGAPSISSVTDNGDGTLTIQGGNFGSKARAAPILHDLATMAYEQGVENTLHSTLTDLSQIPATNLYDDTGVPYISFNRPKRHAGSSGSYLGHDAENKIGWPFTHGGRGDRSAWAGQPSLYLGIWKRHSANPHWASRFGTGDDPAWRNLSYTANNPNDFLSNTWPAMGEQVIIDEGGPEEITGTLVGVWERDIEEDQAWIQFDGRIAGGNYGGMTLRGLTSNVTVTIPVAGQYGFARRSLTRVWQNSARVGYNEYASPDRVFDVDGNVVGDTTLYESFYSSRDWMFWEWEVTLAEDWRNSSLAMFVNGQLIGRGVACGSDSVGQYVPTAGGPTLAQAGDSISDGLDLAGWEMDEVYVDNTRQRVYLADVNALSGGATVTPHKRELQKILSWSDSQIVIERRDGALSGALYLYVANSLGSINDQGYTV